MDEIDRKTVTMKICDHVTKSQLVMIVSFLWLPCVLTYKTSKSFRSESLVKSALLQVTAVSSCKKKSGQDDVIYTRVEL